MLVAMTWIRVSFLIGSIHILIYTLIERGIRRLLGQCFVAVQSISHVWLFANPWTAAFQASLSITISRSLLKLMFIETAVPSSHFILSSPSHPAFNLSQHQSLFQWASSLNKVAQGLELQLQHRYFQWIFRIDFL